MNQIIRAAFSRRTAWAACLFSILIASAALAEPMKPAAGRLVILNENANTLWEDNEPSVPMGKPHLAVLQLRRLVSNQTYSGRLNLIDPKGNSWVSQSFSVKVDGPKTTVRCDFTPNPEVHQSGQWTWKAEVAGMGRFTNAFIVRPPTAMEMAQFRQQMQITKALTAVLTNYWLEINGDCFTKIVAVRETLVPDKFQAQQRDQRVAELEAQLKALKPPPEPTASVIMNPKLNWLKLTEDYKANTAKLKTAIANAANEPVALTTNAIFKETLLQIQGVTDGLTGGDSALFTGAQDGMVGRQTWRRTFTRHRIFQAPIGWSNWETYDRYRLPPICNALTSEASDAGIVMTGTDGVKWENGSRGSSSTSAEFVGKSRLRVFTKAPQAEEVLTLMQQRTNAEKYEELTSFAGMGRPERPPVWSGATTPEAEETSQPEVERLADEVFSTYFKRRGDSWFLLSRAYSGNPVYLAYHEAKQLTKSVAFKQINDTDRMNGIFGCATVSIQAQAYRRCSPENKVWNSWQGVSYNLQEKLFQCTFTRSTETAPWQLNRSLPPVFLRDYFVPGLWGGHTGGARFSEFSKPNDEALDIILQGQ